jgi:hypothetical protein
MCVDCHGLNPSQFTGRTGGPSGSSSHIVGPTSRTEYLWGGGIGGTQDDVTPEAGAFAEYGGGNEIICTSCHIILTDQATVVARSDNGASNADNEASTADSIGLLLSTSGNNSPDTATDNDFLCTGCHGASPSTGGGNTHPVQPTVTVDMSTAIGNNASAADNGVTHIGANNGSSTGGINCESCHRPHNAAMDVVQGSNIYILENVEDNTTWWNEQVLCSSCHGN